MSGYLAAAVGLVLTGGLVAAVTVGAPPLSITLGVTSDAATAPAEFAATTGVPAAIQGW